MLRGLAWFERGKTIFWRGNAIFWRGRAWFGNPKISTFKKKHMKT